MAFQNVTLKVANMRKEQEFTVYPNGTSQTHILLQSDKRVARLNKETGEFEITKNNYNYPIFGMLQVDSVKVEISEELKQEIKRAYHALSNGKDGVVRIL